MTGNSTEETGLIDIAIRDSIVIDQNELIAQLVQQVAEMRKEIRQTRDLAKLAIATSTPASIERRPFPSFPSLSSPLPNYFPSHTTTPISSMTKSPTIDLSIQNPLNASS
ncbi:hypothetical protein HAX54_020576 [Datura stramonium]|uniref:Uncharacterized protein n=1 Tax=Datura stramonium TaxID=4076 RepID=A0ABS8UTS4_DATST|nr:hypothetical protein [Datura stramonium]